MGSPCAVRSLLLRVAPLALASLVAGSVAAAEAQLTAAGGDTSDTLGGGAFPWTFGGGPGVALGGDVLVAGVKGTDLPGQGNQGSAVVWRRSGASWVEEQTLVSSVGDGNDAFGYAVDVCGDVIVVGAPYDDVAGVVEQGSATVFRWNGGSWIEEQTLTVASGEQGDAFGGSVSISGDVIVVGAAQDDIGTALVQGSATVFRWNGASWIEEQTLTAAGGAMFDNFGVSVSVSGHSLAVGAWQDEVAGLVGAGSVTMYRWNGSSWLEEQTLSPAAVATGDNFGTCVRVSGDVVVGGSPFDDDAGLTDAGSVTAFRWNGVAWVEGQTLRHVAPEAHDAFGASVALRGHSLLVGTPMDDLSITLNPGSASLFRWDGSAWVFRQLIASGDHAAHDFFGASVAVEGDLGVVGAPDHDVAGKANQGAAYVYDLLTAPWSDEGPGLAGVFGVPRLDGGGTLGVGSGNAVGLSLAAPGATAALFLGLASTPLPFKGGTLYPGPFLPPVFVSTSPSGTVPIPFAVAGGLPSGTELWLQWGIVDSEALFGVALSNALRGVAP